MLTTSLCARLAASILIFATPLAHADQPERPSAGAQAAEREPAAGWQLRVYDVGDLPAHNGDAGAPPVETGAYIAEQLGLPNFAMGPGLLAVQAEAADHDRLTAAFESLRSTYAERVALRVAIHRVGGEGDGGARVGARFEGRAGSALAEHQQVAYRRLPVRIFTGAARAVVTEANPIVGTGSAAIDTAVETLEEGLDIRLHIGPDRDGRAVVRIVGGLTAISIEDAPSYAVADITLTTPFQLPTIQRRSVDSAVSVSLGEETIFAIVQSPSDPAERLALTVMIASVQP